MSKSERRAQRHGIAGFSRSARQVGNLAGSEGTPSSSSSSPAAPPPPPIAIAALPPRVARGRFEIFCDLDRGRGPLDRAIIIDRNITAPKKNRKPTRRRYGSGCGSMGGGAPRCFNG
jgi:hypothetical protein